MVDISLTPRILTFNINGAEVTLNDFGDNLEISNDSRRIYFDFDEENFHYSFYYREIDQVNGEAKGATLSAITETLNDIVFSIGEGASEETKTGIETKLGVSGLTTISKEVVGAINELDAGKSDTGHQHQTDDISGLATFIETTMNGHTHTASEITDFATAIEAVLAPGTGIDITISNGVITISNTGGSGGLDTEAVIDAIAGALTGGSNITITHNDAGNTITIATTATVNETDEYLLNADNHESGTTNKVFTANDKTKLDGIAVGANNYTHPANHDPSIITETSLKRFTSDAEIEALDTYTDLSEDDFEGDGEATPISIKESRIEAIVTGMGLAPVASPAFTDTPTAPTPTIDNNSTQIATTEFVVDYATDSMSAVDFERDSETNIISIKRDMLQEVIEDFVAGMMVAGSDVSFSYNDTTGKLTVTASVSGGSGSGFQLLPRVSTPVGEWSDNAFFASSATTTAASANTVEVSPFILPETTYVDEFAVNVSTLIAASTFTIVVYSSNTDGWPDELLYESGDLDGSTTGLRTAVTDFTFTGGVQYWLGVKSSAAIVFPSIPLGDCIGLGASPTNPAQHYAIMRKSVTYANPAPSTWTYAFADKIAGVAAKIVRYKVTEPPILTPITLVGNISSTFDSPNTQTVVTFTDAQDGDVQLVLFGTENGEMIATTPSGWDLITSTTYMQLFGRVRQSGDASTTNFVHEGSDLWSEKAVSGAIIRNGDYANRILGTVSSDYGTTVTPAAVTATKKSLALAMITLPFTANNPVVFSAGWTEQQEGQVANKTSAYATKEIAGAGTTGSPTITFSEDQYEAFIIVIPEV